LPLQDAASGLTLTAGARLDNRDALLHQLGFEKDESQTATADSEISLHAYQKWGEDCVFHLEGNWHFAIWDARQQKLFLARDQQGNSGLYYFHGPRFFAFASAKKGLLALEAIPQKPDLQRLTQVLTAWPGDGVRTAYEQILRLPDP
jgi:asparagine synthase (glutamine-hydrolysing)